MPGVTTAYQTGVHGSRPANGAGCILYDCTTHGLIYRDDGTSWTTFATLGSTGGYTPGGTDVAIADGGTGQSTATLGFNALSPVTTRGDLIVRGVTNNQRLALGTSGYVLTSDGTDAAWAVAGSGNMATDALWDAAGDLALGTGANTAAKLVIGTSGKVLTSNGTTASWQTPAAGSSAPVNAAALVTAYSLFR